MGVIMLIHQKVNYGKEGALEVVVWTGFVGRHANPMPAANATSETRRAVYLLHGSSM